MKILMVDDDPLTRGVISAILTKSGHDVMEAESGEAAVAAVQSVDQLDIVLMDINMPGMGGIAARTKIRTLPGWRGQLPVMWMSANDPPEKLLATFDGFAPKGRLETLDAAMAEGVATAQARINYDQQVARTSPSLWKQVWDSAPRVGIIFACFTVFYGGVSFITGGLRPSSLVDIEAGKKETGDLRERIAELRGLIGQCNLRVDGAQALIPRDAENRTSHLEAHFDELRERVGKTEYVANDALARVGALTIVTPRSR